MRVIHTSDWHLGQHFMGKSRLKEHECFLAWLVKTIQDRKADALVVAGDIFDTGTPPSYARTLYNEFIVAMQGTGCRNILILGGNHDAAATLNEGRGLLEYLHTAVVAGRMPDAGGHVKLFLNRDNAPGLLVCAIPFLRPADLMKSVMGLSGADRQAAMVNAIQAFYAAVFGAAKEKQHELARQGIAVPIMATGHLTVVGGRSSESVRDIYIGTLDAFPASGFPPADYLALGHLHRGQQVKKQDHVRYCGSPIPLSFDEAGHPKQVLAIDFTADGLACVTPVFVPVFRQLVTVEGSLEQIEKALQDLEANTGRTPEGGKSGRPEAWLEARVSADLHLPDLPERIREMIAKIFPAGNVPELLRVCRQGPDPRHLHISEARERLEELTPEQVFARRLEMADLPQERAQTLTGLFDQVLDEIATKTPENASTQPQDPDDAISGVQESSR